MTFVLKRPQPAFLALLASRHVASLPVPRPAGAMRQHPIGTGPFKFVEFKPNEFIKVVKNPDYWKPGLPHLDAIEYTILRNRSTAILAFVAGKYELTFAWHVDDSPDPRLQKQAAQTQCANCRPGSVSTNLIINREKPPFDNPELRRAMSLAIDRQAFIDILTEGKGFSRGGDAAPAGGQWGMPLDMLEKLPGYGPDVAANRDKAREIMKKLGYGPDKRMHIKVSTRDITAISRPGGDPDRPDEGDLHRRRARARSTPRSGIPRCTQGLRRRAQPAPAPWSTTLMRCFSRITPAAGSAITTAIATPRSTG